MTGRTWRVAVVGTGPSGTYAAGHLVDHFDGDLATPSLARDGERVEVDLYDRLPTPWGLVRGGVAPDHAGKKGVTRVFDAISTHPGVRFLGGVEVGRDVGVDELARWYDAVIYAYGADHGRVVDVPGADGAGVHTAHDVVAWYNGHPDHAEDALDLSGERVVVIGNGNVALDVARILALPPGALAGTDVAGGAEAVLRDAATTEIVVVGRRGPWDAAFGTAEIEELAAVEGLDVVVDPADLPDPADPPAGAGRAARRTVATLRRLAGRAPSAAGRRRVVLRFFERPVAVEPGGIRLESTRPADAARPARATALAATAVVLATGYRSSPLPGLPFDADRSLLPTDGAGRVVDEAGVAAPGAYAAGWVKRGPSGMIGSNKACARETVRTLVADAHAGAPSAETALDHATVLATLRARRPDLVSWHGWRAIDRVETGRGRAQGRPRVKLTRVDELLAAGGGR